ncbi:unannotated protein [freshwater metagenome]|uniref:Unannotated protein n=1 Tax=freshwater metagenome TaxID=449393 RepID=A0A6J6ZSP9_9ZZZZ
MPLYGAATPAFGATFGMRYEPSLCGVAFGPAAITAAGLLGDWSTMMLLIIRGSESWMLLGR